jgi:hypothetical protein
LIDFSQEQIRERSNPSFNGSFVVGIHPKIVVEEGLQFFHEKFATIV